MESGEAREIVELLADGVNPVTGEIFNDDSPYSHPQIVRALYTVLNLLDKKNARAKRSKDLPKNAGQSWNAEEDEFLAENFDKGKSVKELAEMHGRTEGAISSRLMRLGKFQIGDN